MGLQQYFFESYQYKEKGYYTAVTNFFILQKGNDPLHILLYYCINFGIWKLYFSFSIICIKHFSKQLEEVGI